MSSQESSQKGGRMVRARKDVMSETKVSKRQERDLDLRIANGL